MPRDKTGHFYYSWFPTIYQQDTQHLTPAEDGVYRRLIDHYMLTRAPLPSDDRALARIVGIGLDEWSQIKTQPVSYFKPDGLFLRHSFCDEVLSADAERIMKARSNGGKGGRPRSSKDKGKTQPVSSAEPTGNPVGSPNPTLNNPELPVREEIPNHSSIKPPTSQSGGFKKQNGGGGWDILQHINDAALQRAKGSAPGWDIYNLAIVYNTSAVTRGIPDNPNAAFPAWCGKYTKGKRP